MRDLSTLGHTGTYIDGYGKILARVFISARKKLPILGWHIKWPGTGTGYYRDIQDLRMVEIRKACQHVGELLTVGELKQELG